MVHTERPDESSSQDWSPQRSPGVSRPMYEARHVVDKQLRDNKADEGGERTAMLRYGFSNEEDP